MKPSDHGTRLVVEPELMDTWSNRTPNLVFQRDILRTLPPGYLYTLHSAKLPDRNQLLTQIESARELERLVLPKISTRLNELHQARLPTRSWNILVGHWLRALCENVVRRQAELSSLDFSSSYLTLTDAKITEKVIPTTTAVGISFMSDPRWSHLVYAKTFESIGLGMLVTPAKETQLLNSQIAVRDSQSKAKATVFPNESRWFAASPVSLGSRILSNAGVLTSTYMSRKSQLQLLVSIPPRALLFRSLSPKIRERRPNLDVRESLSASTSGLTNAPTAELIWRLFWLVCPKSFLENFGDHFVRLRQSLLPANPRFVLTGNGFDGPNDLMRTYLAKVTAQGSKYIVNQHGNMYGTSIFRSPSIEEQTSDIFITWGWSAEKSHGRYVSLGRSRELPQRRSAGRSGALFVLDAPTSPAGILEPRVWDREIFARQTSAIGRLPESVIRKSTLRFHPAQPYRWPNQKSEWASKFPQLAQNDGVDPIHKLIRRHEITVFLYDSTGVLEALQSNHPTICFLPEGLDHVASKSLADFQGMVAEGIFLTRAEDLERFFDDYSNEIDTWWRQKRRQTVVAEFAAKYSRRNHFFARDIRRIISKT